VVQLHKKYDRPDRPVMCSLGISPLFSKQSTEENPSSDFLKKTISS
jgi:hypothetical protein